MPMLNMRFVLPITSSTSTSSRGSPTSARTMVRSRSAPSTRQRDLEFSDILRAHFPIMHEALLQVGHRQTRNRGTIGGSLCHLDPAAELVSLATGYDATVSSGRTASAKCRSPNSRGLHDTLDRTKRGGHRRALPALGIRSSTPSSSFPRRHGDFAITSAAVLTRSTRAARSRAPRSPSEEWAQPRPVPGSSSSRSPDKRRAPSFSAMPASCPARSHRRHSRAGKLPPASRRGAVPARIGEGACADRASA